MAELEGFKPLKMTKNPAGLAKPKDASSVYLTREDGTGFWVTHGVTDKADGVTDADFDFAHGDTTADTDD